MTTETTDLPRASKAGRTASLFADRGWLIQTGLFLAGGVLLPLGIVVICLGWYGIAHTAYQYDQLVYIVSGGLLGVGITVAGGFLYFGAWIARSSSEQKAANQRLAEAIQALADATLRGGASAASTGFSASLAERRLGRPDVTEY